MDEKEVKLLGTSASPFSLRIEIALKLKGIAYEFIEEDLSNKTPLLLKSNPVHRKIPVLIHHGKPVSESLIILEYIENTWKNNPFLPQDPYQKAMVFFWAKYIDEKVWPTAWKIYFCLEEDQKEIVEQLWELLDVLENELNGNGNENENDIFWGETIGYVDIVGILLAFWFQLMHEVLGKELIPEKRFICINKWFKRLLENEQVNQCLPPTEKLRSRLETAKASIGLDVGLGNILV